MYLIAEALVRWLAPVLSFTAEEIWRHMPGDREESVFMETWFLLPEMFLPDDADGERFGLAFWQEVLAVREAVGKELEKVRVAGGIGSSLDAEVDLYCEPQLREKLARLEDELRFVLITSYARVHALDEQPDDAVSVDLRGIQIGVRVTPSTHGKCVRCWHHREDFGASTEHPELCGRCVENVVGDGEHRAYA
jgi:isoleucyl-tRNA synthetase